MHNLKYSRGVKAVAVILQTIFVVITVVALSVCFSYQGITGGTGDMLEGRKFVEVYSCIFIISFYCYFS